MSAGKSDGLLELAQLISATGGNKKAELNLKVSSGGSLTLSVTNSKGQDIIMQRGSNIKNVKDPNDGIDTMARWAFYALAGKALGVNV